MSAQNNKVHLITSIHLWILEHDKVIAENICLLGLQQHCKNVPLRTPLEVRRMHKQDQIIPIISVFYF